MKKKKDKANFKTNGQFSNMCGEKMNEQRTTVFNTTNFIMFFIHCNVLDLECNVHDSVSLSNKEGTQHKRNIYEFII